MVANFYQQNVKRNGLKYPSKKLLVKKRTIPDVDDVDNLK